MSPRRSQAATISLVSLSIALCTAVARFSASGRGSAARRISPYQVMVQLTTASVLESGTIESIDEGDWSQLYDDWTKASNELLAGVRTELGIRDQLPVTVASGWTLPVRSGTAYRPDVLRKGEATD